MYAFIGKWQLHESENFEEYMEAIGVEDVLRRRVSESKPILDISINNDVNHIKISTKFKSFEVGDCKTVKSNVIKVSDTKFVETQLFEEDNIIVKEVIGDMLYVSLEYKGIKSFRTFKKIN